MQANCCIHFVLQEFQRIVLEIVTRAVIPILPVFIAVTFPSLSWEGTITRQLPTFAVVILIIRIGHFILTGVLGFDANGTVLVLAVFALQDSFGTACNITGDGALTLILSGYADKHHITAAPAAE